MNVIDSYKLERDTQISLRNLRKLDCAGKAAQRPNFPHPALQHVPEMWVRFSDKDMLQLFELARILDRSGDSTRSEYALASERPVFSQVCKIAPGLLSRTRECERRSKSTA